MRKIYFKFLLLIGLCLFLKSFGQAQNLTWQPKKSLKYDVPSRYGAAMAALNGKLYIIGGINNGAIINLVDFLEYDPSTGVYTHLTHPNTGSNRVAFLLAVNGKLYTYWGPGFYEYNFATDSWVTKAPAPGQPISNTTPVVIG